MSHISIHPPEFSGNQGNHQSFEKSLLYYKCWIIFIKMKQKKIQKFLSSPQLDSDWEAGPQTSAHCQCPKKWYSSTGMTTLISQNQLPDIYLDRLNFFWNMPLLSYLWCPIMKTNFNQFFRFYTSRVHDFC